MTELQAGDKAPYFEAPNENGEPVNLNQYKGKKLVLYFYPKDNTPGCTTESCNLRDHYAVLQKQGYEILGVSADSSSSHTKFIKKYNLPFSLLADTDRTIANAYGVWGEKNLYGIKYMGIIRTTFIIDESGNIEEVIRKVNNKAHAAQILKTT